MIDLSKRFSTEFHDIIKLIQKIKNNELTGFKWTEIHGIIDIRPGYKISKGHIQFNLNPKTGKKEPVPAIVFIVDSKLNPDNLDRSKVIPDVLDGIQTDVAIGNVLDRFKLENLSILGKQLPGSASPTTDYLIEAPVLDIKNTEALQRSLPQIGYVPPTDFKLDEVTEAMTLLCHVSPEQGWLNLKKFLQDVNTGDFTMGMYDYSAQHIADEMVEIAKRDIPFYIVYDGKAPAGAGKSGNKENDISEDQINQDIQDKAVTIFDHVKAALGKSGLFANAYHIKLAVNNKKKFWLSSGNWQSSNQPVITDEQPFSYYLKNYNREWHVILDNSKLAGMYHDFLMYDLTKSQEIQETKSFLQEEMLSLPDQFFKLTKLSGTDPDSVKQILPKSFVFTNDNPLRIQPLLTPDNYIDMVLPLINGAQKRIWFQNQYINITKTMSDKYQELLTALKDKCNQADVDCRIILRYEPKSRAMVESLVAYGFPIDKIKIQNNCHNKGILIDNGITIIGSHNWSNYGVELNRDASLIIYNKEICQYYSDVYDQDWKYLSSFQVESNASSDSPNDGTMMHFSSFIED